MTKFGSPVRWALPVVVLLGLLAPLRAENHVPPPVLIEMDIREAEIRAYYEISAELYQHWLGRDPWLLGDESADEYRVAGDEFAGFLAAKGTVTIDRVPVRAVVEELFLGEDEDNDEVRGFIGVHARYSLKAQPRQIGFLWNRWDTIEGLPLQIARMIITSGGDFLTVDLIEDEPEHIWHAPAEVIRAPVKPFVPAPPPTFPLPIASVCLLGVLLLGIPFRRFLPSRRAAWGSVAAVLVLATALSGLAQVRLPAPWSSATRLPDEAEARYLFEGLHENIYRAFDYETETEIYDALAQSLTPELVEAVYLEIYGSLILRDDGGAVCDVRSVKILESNIQLPTEAHSLRFDVDCRWQVTGTVNHWGHTHWRTNEYRALYSVQDQGAQEKERSADGGSQWRIASVEVLEQARTGSDTEGQAPRGAAD